AGCFADQKHGRVVHAVREHGIPRRRLQGATLKCRHGGPELGHAVGGGGEAAGVLVRGGGGRATNGARGGGFVARLPGRGGGGALRRRGGSRRRRVNRLRLVHVDSGAAPEGEE